jgi:YfiH family protein
VTPPGGALGAGVGFRFTDRNGGRSHPPYASLNLGTDVGDDPAAVAANRQLAAAACRAGRAGVAWMQQVHGDQVRYAGEQSPEREPEECDAVYTDVPGLVLGVLVADCVPVLLADPGARLAGAAHAGRAGLVAGVVPALVAAMARAGASPERMRAVIGPAICGGCYEVPGPLRDRVSAAIPEASCTTSAGTPGLDIAAGVRAQLSAAGVPAVGHDPRCTRESAELYSYRRDGVTGRLAGLVWLAGPASG